MTVDAIRKLRDAERHGTVQWLAYDARACEPHDPTGNAV